MSKINYTVLAFDDMTSEFVVSFNSERLNVPAAVLDGKIDEENTKKNIEASIRSSLLIKKPEQNPGGYDKMIGTVGEVDLSTEEA